MLGGGSDVVAQSSELNSEQQEAIALVQAGELAAGNGRWADAVEAFEAANRISPAYTILYNLAYARRALGHYLEARQALTDLLEQYVDIPQEIRDVAREMRDEVGERVARITLHGLAEEPGIGIRLNGQIRTVGLQRPIELEVNPGSHALTVLLSGHEDFMWSGRLADGDERVVDVGFSAVVRESSGSVLGSPLFWTLTGLVLAGGGVGLGLWLHDRAQLVPSQAEPMMVISLD